MGKVKLDLMVDRSSRQYRTEADLLPVPLISLKYRTVAQRQRGELDSGLSQTHLFVTAVAQFHLKANRSGAYARVLRAGPIETGMVGQRTPAPSEAPTLEEVFELLHRSPKDPDRLRRALAHPVAERVRIVLEQWLKEVDQTQT